MPRVRQDVELPEGGGEGVRELRVADLRVEDPDTRRVRVQQPLCLGVPRQQLADESEDAERIVWLDLGGEGGEALDEAGDAVSAELAQVVEGDLQRLCQQRDLLLLLRRVSGDAENSLEERVVEVLQVQVPDFALVLQALEHAQHTVDRAGRREQGLAVGRVTGQHQRLDRLKEVREEVDVDEMREAGKTLKYGREQLARRRRHLEDAEIGDEDRVEDLGGDALDLLLRHRRAALFQVLV
mmetsp:Transcript_60318/g.142352  ORF Transcript_60318/g.142352 Transcript_60318/m.142352 type:complete len:240 (-) Transcript_60318:214-933(-)